MGTDMKKSIRITAFTAGADFFRRKRVPQPCGKTTEQKFLSEIKKLLTGDLKWINFTKNRINISHSGLIYENDCPIDSFSSEHWKEIIISGTGCEAQFCPCPDKVLALLDKSDFSSCSSYNICMCLALEGEWLAPLLPLENIEQEDFDNILVCDPDEYESEDEFLELVGARFPDRVIPPHLNYPHKGNDANKFEKQ